MFNKAWIYLALILIPLGLIGHVKAWLALSAFLLTVLGIAWWWNRRCLVGVRYERLLSATRAFPGEVVDLTLRLTNQKLLPLSWLMVEDQWSMNLPLVEGELFPSATGKMGLFRSALSMRWFERVSRGYRLRCTRRGFYPLGPVRFRAGDIFGLFQSEETQEDLDWLIVYPQVLPLEALGFPPKEPLGEVKAAWRIFEDPVRPVGVREHQPGDSFRDVHWKASARRQDLQVKVYEPTTSHNLVLFLNVSTFARHWHGIDPIRLEKTIGVTASIASHAVDQRFIVGLIANGSVPHSDQPIKVLPSRRPDQLSRLLEALAAVTSFPTCSIDALLMTESPRLPWGATLVVVTSIVTDELRATMLRLREVGRRLVLVALEEESDRAPISSVPGVPIYRLPLDRLPFDEEFLGQAEDWAADVALPWSVGGFPR